MKQYYFISGLPRSGSTLLSAILKQNPRFHAGITTNLLSHFRANIETGNAAEYNEDRLKRILHGLVESYHADADREVIFDTNRLWTAMLPSLRELYPNTKVICCVRDINWIIDSFERLHQKNPLSISTVFPKEVDMHVYSRSSSLMSEGGLVRLPYDALKSALVGPHNDMLMIVEYDLLVKQPEAMMKSIYNFIGQPYYDHDFEQVEDSYDEYDSKIKLKGLHSTKKRVEWTPRRMVLPPDVLSQYKDLEVWRDL